MSPDTANMPVLATERLVSVAITAVDRDVEEGADSGEGFGARVDVEPGVGVLQPFALGGFGQAQVGRCTGWCRRERRGAAARASGGSAVPSRALRGDGLRRDRPPSASCSCHETSTVRVSHPSSIEQRLAAYRRMARSRRVTAWRLARCCGRGWFRVRCVATCRARR